MEKFNCILLVDDDGTANYLHCRILEQLKLTDNIHTETNGEKALNFLSFFAERNNNYLPELILLDLKMPVLDGFDFLEYLKIKKASNKDIVKVIVISTTSHEDDLKKLRKDFNIKFISKPLTKEKLLSALKLKN